MTAWRIALQLELKASRDPQSAIVARGVAEGVTAG
jgi:hypothetical protein